MSPFDYRVPGSLWGSAAFKGGDGGGSNDATYFQNIANDSALKANNHQRDLENQAAQEKTVADQRARDDEAARQGRITGNENGINSSFDSMFTPDYFSGQTKAYQNYYKPQLDDKYADTQKQLTYWLADKGLLDSSTRNDKTADLQKTYDTANRDINNGALDFVNNQKSSIANTRSSLIGDARNGNAVDAPTVTGALSTLQSPQVSYAPPVFNASGSANTFADMFGTFTNALAQQGALERASTLSGGMINPAFNTGLFGGSSGSVRNIA
jgi:hypothetical protein